jgi:hypothetical protein
MGFVNSKLWYPIGRQVIDIWRGRFATYGVSHSSANRSKQRSSFRKRRSRKPESSHFNKNQLRLVFFISLGLLSVQFVLLCCVVIAYNLTAISAFLGIIRLAV